MEEQAIGTKLTQLQATDSDSNIEAYHLSANDYFEMNNLTGKPNDERSQIVGIFLVELTGACLRLCLCLRANKWGTQQKLIYHNKFGKLAHTHAQT